MERLIQDLRYAFRSLFRQPSFAVTAIATLALGIGATTAIFTVLNAVILRPLPFDRPDRLVAVMNVWTRTGLRSTSISAPDFHDWEAQSRSFTAMAYYTGGETSVTLGRNADYAVAYRVTPRFFDALGVRAAVGRLLTEQEQAPGGPLAVVISDAFWKKQFNGSAAAIGATVKFADRVFTIAGVLPTRTSWSGTTSVSLLSLLVGYCSASRVEMPVISARACARLTPSASRARTR